MNEANLKNIIEAALLASGAPMKIDQLLDLFDHDARPDRTEVREALETLESEYDNRGIELKEVASGFRIQVRTTMTEALSRMWQDRPPRYSRALMETLAPIAYRQPITRSEIEEIRGVSVSTNIMRTLLERIWVRVVGHRDVPGKPAMYATTKQFLDYFGLKKLEDLPPLSEIRDLDSLNVELDLAPPDETPIAEIAPPEISREDDAGPDEYKYAEPLTVTDKTDSEPAGEADMEEIADSGDKQANQAVDN